MVCPDGENGVRIPFIPYGYAFFMNWACRSVWYKEQLKMRPGRNPFEPQ